MKFFHLSDLHIGKQLHGYSLAVNQRKILKQVVELAKAYKPDAILIAGDVYDKSVPSGEAFTIFDEFLQNLAGIEPGIPVLIIAGNHDSPERLQFASSFLEKHQIYIATMPPREEDEHMQKVTLQDGYGDIDFWMLPFTKPGYVRKLFEEQDIRDYQTAIRLLLERENIDFDKRNVLLSHQFYSAGGTLPQVCDSETSSVALQVGGLDVIDVSVLNGFDYVALGHIHGQQMAGRETVRYCGTPLKYSVSEEYHHKSITMVTINEKGQDIVIDKLPLKAEQDVRRERGLLEEIIESATAENCNDFISVTITDEIEPYQPKEQLEKVYPYLLELKVDNTRTRKLFQEEDLVDKSNMSPMDNFREFYRQIHHADMTAVEEEVMMTLISEVAGGFEE